MLCRSNRKRWNDLTSSKSIGPLQKRKRKTTKNGAQKKTSPSRCCPLPGFFLVTLSALLMHFYRSLCCYSCDDLDWVCRWPCSRSVSASGLATTGVSIIRWWPALPSWTCLLWPFRTWLTWPTPIQGIMKGQMVKLLTTNICLCRHRAGWLLYRADVARHQHIIIICVPPFEDDIGI